MYYIKFNNVDLTQMVKVREISLPSLPEIEHDSIDLWEMDGNIFNSVSYGNRTITLRLLIQPLDPLDIETLTQDVKRAFYTRTPQELYLGDENKYMLCLPEGEVVISELGVGTNELEVDLIAYYPYWISTEVQIVNFTDKHYFIENKGDVSTTPVISMGIKSDTHFIQVDNQSTGERIFLGEKPTVEKDSSIKANSNILLDQCNSTSGWTSSNASLDNGCGVGGTLSVTNNGNGIMCGDFGNSNSTWTGACYRKNFSVGIVDFKVRVDMTFTSDGMNGDPSVKKYMDDCISTESGGSKVVVEQVITGTKVPEYYSYHSSGGLITIRNGASTSATQIGLFSPDQLFFDGVVQSNGWLKISLPWFNNNVGYVQPGYYIEKQKTNHVVTVVNKTVTPTWTATLCNFVVNTTAKLRSGANEDSSVKCTVKAGTVLRCSTTLIDSTKEGENNKYWQVYSGAGTTGYIEEKELTRASEVEIVYEQTPVTADDKTGRCQVYGFSSTGVQLFSLSIIDDSEWYEATYPIIKKNGKEFLRDTSFNVPDPKQTKEFSSNTIKYSNIMSGEYGKWNGFQGSLYIERIKNVWYAWVQGQRKKISTSKTVDNTNASLPLSYIVVYFGTCNTDKPCDMAITEIRVQNVNEINFETQNIQHFEAGDIVEIDCGVPCVRLNGEEKPSLVDIGSQFFDLQKGVNVIKISSDKDINTSIAYNERYL